MACHSSHPANNEVSFLAARTCSGQVSRSSLCRDTSRISTPHLTYLYTPFSIFPISQTSAPPPHPLPHVPNMPDLSPQKAIYNFPPTRCLRGNIGRGSLHKHCCKLHLEIFSSQFIFANIIYFDAN